MNNANIIRILNVVAVVAATFGSCAVAVPSLHWPPALLAIGIFVAMFCKSLAIELVQVKGQSDESQGITPVQIAAQRQADVAVAAHNAALVNPVVGPLPIKPVVIIFALLGFCFCASAQTTNHQTVVSNVTMTVSPPAFPALSGIVGTIGNSLIDDSPYITNGIAEADLVGLYNSSNPKGTGKVGFFGDVTFPTTKQSAVGIGAGIMAHHSFVTPISLTLGTTLTNLPAALGKVYTFISDGPLYDFTGKQVGNWAATGFFKSWTINPKYSIGIKGGVYDDSVIPGIGWFGDVEFTF